MSALKKGQETGTTGLFHLRSNVSALILHRPEQFILHFRIRLIQRFCKSTSIGWAPNTASLPVVSFSFAVVLVLLKASRSNKPSVNNFLMYNNLAS